MPFERKQWNDRYQHHKVSERYTGKIQYLRQEHGYIRSKVKINGIRDVTFNFTDVDPTDLKTLEVGDIVSFGVNIYSSGKFCAIGIRKQKCTDEVCCTRSDSPISILSSDHCTENTYIDIGNFSAKQNVCDSEVTSCCSPIKYCDSSMDSSMNHSFVIPFLTKEQDEVDQFTQNVNSFLERVITRNYDVSCTTCWLTY